MSIDCERARIRALMQQSRAFGARHIADLCDRALNDPGDEEAYEIAATLVGGDNEDFEDELRQRS